MSFFGALHISAEQIQEKERQNMSALTELRKAQSGILNQIT